MTARRPVTAELAALAAGDFAAGLALESRECARRRAVDGVELAPDVAAMLR